MKLTKTLLYILKMYHDNMLLWSCSLTNMVGTDLFLLLVRAVGQPFGTAYWQLYLNNYASCFLFIVDFMLSYPVVTKYKTSYLVVTITRLAIWLSL